MSCCATIFAHSARHAFLPLKLRDLLDDGRLDKLQQDLAHLTISYTLREQSHQPPPMKNQQWESLCQTAESTWLYVSFGALTCLEMERNVET
jgi:hypothetical protein